MEKTYNEFNSLLNNTNTFLLDVSVPIIYYLLKKNDNFEEIFKQTCNNNRRFASGTLEHELFAKTNDFIMSIASASEYIGCSCHDKTWAKFHQEITRPLHEYCLSLLHIVDSNKYNEKLAALSSDFGDDYRVVSKDLAENRIELAQAEQAIVCWQGAIPDSFMQESILQLRYEYIRKLYDTLLYKNTPSNWIYEKNV